MILIFTFIIITLIVQVILKTNSKKTVSAGKGYLLEMYLNPLVLFAYLLSFANILLWIYLLRQYNLAYLTLISSLSFVLILPIDFFLFGVRPTLINITGAILIFLGIWIVA
jgi:hypothetical protein